MTHTSDLDNWMATKDQIMREMSRIALDQATRSIAMTADQFAHRMRAGTIPEPRGADALTAFANAIRSTSARVWPSKGAA